MWKNLAKDMHQLYKKYHTRDNDLFGGRGLIVFKLSFVRQNEGYTFSHSHSTWLIPGRAVEVSNL